jgi:hypothetical protein
MRKVGYLVAAVGAMAIVAPTIASAETVVIKRGHHDWGRARAEYRVHRNWHPGWHRDHSRVVIKERRW